MVKLVTNQRDKNIFATNLLIDCYINSYKKRRQNSEKKIIIFINYFTIISNLIFIFNLCLGLVFKLKYETKLLLFDLSMFFGGIEKYNKIILIFTSILAITLNYKLRVEASEYIEQWVLIYEMMKIKTMKLFLEKRSSRTLNNLIKSIKIIFPILSTLFIIMGNIH